MGLGGGFQGGPKDHRVWLPWEDAGFWIGKCHREGFAGGSWTGAAESSSFSPPRARSTPNAVATTRGTDCGRQLLDLCFVLRHHRGMQVNRGTQRQAGLGGHGQVR